MEADEIEEYVDNMDKDIKRIKSNVLRITWLMRGGIQYTDAMNLSFEERELISDLAEKNIKTTEKTGLPYF